MGVFEIISAIVLIIACVFIVVIVLMKDTKTQMSQTISGTTADSFYQKNAGRTKEAILNKATVVAAVVFFVLALAVNMINTISSKNKNVVSDNSSSSIESYVESESSENGAAADTVSTAADNEAQSNAEDLDSAE